MKAIEAGIATMRHGFFSFVQNFKGQICSWIQYISGSKTEKKIILGRARAEFACAWVIVRTSANDRYSSGVVMILSPLEQLVGLKMKYFSA